MNQPRRLDPPTSPLKAFARKPRPAVGVCMTGQARHQQRLSTAYDYTLLGTLEEAATGHHITACPSNDQCGTGCPGSSTDTDPAR
jgi:hypothetical protein